MPEAVIVGGGVMGFGAARELRRRGLRVRLVERGQPGRAASWASAGIIGATVRDETDPTAELRRASRPLWSSFAEALANESGLDPEYRQTGCLFVARDEAELTWLRRRADALERPSGPGAGAVDSRPVRSGEVLTGAELHELEPMLGPGVLGGVPTAGGSVDPRRLVRGLELAARRAGVELVVGTEVQALATSGGRISGVQTSHGPVTADLVVIAAGAWSGTIRECRPRPPVGPQRGQILALDGSRVDARHVLLTPTDPYLVPRPDGRLVVGATREDAGWDPQPTAGGLAWLLSSAMVIGPGLADCPVVEVWTGFRPLSADGVPLIGAGELYGLYFLTGHGPSGIAPLPASIALLAALIAGEPPPVDPRPFDPLRFA